MRAMDTVIIQLFGPFVFFEVGDGAVGGAGLFYGVVEEGFFWGEVLPLGQVEVGGGFVGFVVHFCTAFFPVIALVRMCHAIS